MRTSCLAMSPTSCSVCNEKSIRMIAYKASRLAVKYSPPTLYLEYTDIQQQHTRVRAVKLSYITHATDLDYLTCKVIKGFPRGLDPSTVNTRQVRQLLQQLVDRACQGQELQYTTRGSRSSRSSGHGEALARSASWDAEAAKAACSAADTFSRSSSCHQHQQQQQQQQQLQQQESGTCITSIQQQPHEQHVRVLNCSVPGTHCGQQQQQCSSAASNQQQQQLQQQQLQQQHPELPSVPPVIRQGMGNRLAENHVCSVKKDSNQQQQQQQQHDISTSIDMTMASCRQEHSSSTQAAKGGSMSASKQPCADIQAATTTPLPTLTAAVPAGSVGEPGCSGSTASSMDGGEDDGGDCLLLDLKWVAPDGGEIDLNKVSDCELRLAKAQMNAAFQLNQLKPGDPSYVYDKQADFSAARGSNDWDDE